MDEWIKMTLGTKVGLDPGDITLDGDPAPPPKKGDTAAPHFLAHVLWLTGWMDQDATWYGGLPQPSPHRVRWGSSSPKSGTAAPHFSAHGYCGQMAGCIKMPLSMEAGLGPGHIALDRDPSLQRGTAPEFLAHVCCGQMAEWIKIPLGTAVGLGSGHVVLDGDSSPPPKSGTAAPQFSAHIYCGQTAGWIKMRLGTELGLGPGDIVHN